MSRVTDNRHLVLFVLEYAEELALDRASLEEVSFWEAMVSLIESRYPKLQDAWNFEAVTRAFNHLDHRYRTGL